MRLRVLLALTALAELAVSLSAQSPYQRWLDEEVRWIIGDEERAAFNRTATDEERLRFIEQFWLRRDPSPATQPNEFREEHYRRVAWANDRFSSPGTLGMMTDRGMIFIRFGAPFARDERPGSERWFYPRIEGVGQNVVLEFVAAPGTNDYRLTGDPSAATPQPR